MNKEVRRNKNKEKTRVQKYRDNVPLMLCPKSLTNPGLSVEDFFLQFCLPRENNNYDQLLIDATQD